MRRMMQSIAVVAALPVAGVAQQATPQSKALSFEVVSIKRSPPDAAQGRAGLMPGGRYVLSNGPIRVLIGIAFPSPTNEIVNAPDWVTNENYDITGVAGPAATFPQVAEMLKTMLADRMRLVARYEMRERPVYELVLASSDGRLGPGLRRSSVDCVALEAAARSRNEIPQPPPPTGPVAQCTLRRLDGLLEANALSMAVLAENLRSRGGRVVIDRTGLTDDYDFKLEWAPDPANSGDARPSLFAALQEQLGLKLQPSTALLPVVVIDSIERPTPN